jgi:hypothetical protein
MTHDADGAPTPPSPDGDPQAPPAAPPAAPIPERPESGSPVPVPVPVPVPESEPEPAPPAGDRPGLRTRGSARWRSFWQAQGPVLAAAVVVFGTTFGVLAQALPSLRDEPNRVRLLVALAAGSLAAAVALVLWRWQRYLGAIVSALLVVGMVFVWTTAGASGGPVPPDPPVRSTPTSRSDRSTTTTVSTTSTTVAETTTAPGSGGGPVRPAGTTAPPVPATTSTTRAPAPCSALPRPGTVVGAPTGTPRVEEVTFELTNLNDPHVEAAGRFVGQLGAGEGLYVVKTADPDTVDSTSGHNPGSPAFFTQRELLAGPGAVACWTYPPKELGYSCAGGITFWLYFLVMPRSTYAGLEGRTGLRSDDVLGSPGVRSLGRLVVPTGRDPGCAGA